MLRDALNEKVISPANMASNSRYVTVGRVISADESNNKCSVHYQNSLSKMVTVDDMDVDLRNSEQWFPSVGDAVVIDATNTPGVVLHQYTENYASDVRGNKKLINDVSADNDVSQFGGTII